MDKINLSPTTDCGKDNSNTQRPRVLALAQQHSGPLSNTAVAGAEAYVKNKHKASKSDGGDVSGAGDHNIWTVKNKS